MKRLIQIFFYNALIYFDVFYFVFNMYIYICRNMTLAGRKQWSNSNPNPKSIRWESCISWAQAVQMSTLPPDECWWGHTLCQETRCFTFLKNSHYNCSFQVSSFQIVPQLSCLVLAASYHFLWAVQPKNHLLDCFILRVLKHVEVKQYNVSEGESNDSNLEK